MIADSIPGFVPSLTSFIKRAGREYTNGRGQRHTENVLLPFLIGWFCNETVALGHKDQAKTGGRMPL
eukprot:1161015-Pelagomonas_calceolata.AAC.3